MVVKSVATKKTETPLAKRGNDETEAYTSFLDLSRRDSLPTKINVADEVSGAINSSDAPNIVQVRDCDEEILPSNVHSQTRENFHTSKGSEGGLGENKQKDEGMRTEALTQKKVCFQVSTGPEYTIKTKQKRNNYAKRKHVRKRGIPSLESLRAADETSKLRKPYLSRADVLGRRNSNSNRNPRTKSKVYDDAAHHISLIVGRAYAWVAEEVPLSWFFFQCLGESVIGAGNTVLSAFEQGEQETRVGEGPGKVLQDKLSRVKESHCQDEQSQSEKGQDENTEEEDFF